MESRVIASVVEQFFFNSMLAGSTVESKVIAPVVGQAYVLLAG